MTTQDLIELLKTFPQDNEVVLVVDDQYQSIERIKVIKPDPRLEMKDRVLLS